MGPEALLKETEGYVMKLDYDFSMPRGAYYSQKVSE